jgi:hypothetical protein
MRNNYCDIHGEYKGPWISCPRCLKIQEKIDNPWISELEIPHRGKDVQKQAPLPCPSCAALRARIAKLEKVAEWACVRLGIVNDPAYSGYTHDLCNEVIAELRRRAKEG